jgi:putative SOS response-associated peptidase YedK
MCGRFASFREAQDLADAFAVAVVADDARLLPPSWNVAPTQDVRIVVERANKETGETTRTLRLARWGLVPSWAHDPSIGTRLINARAESVLEKPSFRRAFSSRRAIVPAEGYYEWQAPASGATTKTKQPYLIRPADDAPLAMAGLYEFWKDESAPETSTSRWLVTTTVITTVARGALAAIHDRQPLMLRPDAWDAWLDPGLDAAAAEPLLRAPVPELVAVRVSTAVNRVGSDGPQLVEVLPD